MSPVLIEEFDPDRTVLYLKMTKSEIKIGDKVKRTKKEIIAYFQRNSICTTSEIAQFMGLTPSRVRDYLSALTKDGIITAEGQNKNRIYRFNQQ